jgi:hypothetical protein
VILVPRLWDLGFGSFPPSLFPWFERDAHDKKKNYMTFPDTFFPAANLMPEKVFYSLIGQLGILLAGVKLQDSKVIEIGTGR